MPTSTMRTQYVDRYLATSTCTNILGSEQCTYGYQNFTIVSFATTSYGTTSPVDSQINISYPTTTLTADAANIVGITFVIAVVCGLLAYGITKQLT